MKKNKKILFKAINPGHIEIFDPPVPSKKMIPEWYRTEHKYTNKSHIVMGENGNPNHTVKNCMPVFDVVTAGYIIKTPVDIFVEDLEDGTKQTHWSSNNIVAVEHHPIAQYSNLSVPPEYYPMALKFIQPWVIETPEGYSCIFMQPSLRDDLPFQIVPAIVDTDKHPIKINFPFFIRKDFTGLIPMNTPIAQIIPFKREDWTHEVVEDLTDKGTNRWISAERKIANRYKTFFRTIKKWD
jgi:hypothetical protein